MKRYRCHKVVEAAKVVGYVPSYGDGPDMFQLEDGGIVAIPVAALANAHLPLVGGYYVRYEDGYTSWSPAAAFEEGYAEIQRNTSTPLERAKREFDELVGRKDALQLFIQNPKFSSLSPLAQSQLLNQYRFMDGYAAVLDERIRSWA